MSSLCVSSRVAQNKTNKNKSQGRARNGGHSGINIEVVYITFSSDSDTNIRQRILKLVIGDEFVKCLC